MQEAFRASSEQFTDLSESRVQEAAQGELYARVYEAEPGSSQRVQPGMDGRVPQGKARADRSGHGRGRNHRLRREAKAEDP